MRRLLLLALTLSFAGCQYFQPREPVLAYSNDSVAQTAQAWADAFNRREKAQLRLLVHPERRDAFDHHAQDLHAMVERGLIAEFQVGPEVIINETRSGRVVEMHYSDGAEPKPIEVLLVAEEGRWWMWRW